MRVFTITAVLGLLVGIAFPIFSALRAIWLRWRKAAQAMPENVSVTHFSVSDVVHIQVNSEDDEDMYGGYLFQVNAGEMLFVSELDIASEQLAAGLFPCQSFELIRLPDVKQIDQLPW